MLFCLNTESYYIISVKFALFLKKTSDWLASKLLWYLRNKIIGDGLEGQLQKLKLTNVDSVQVQVYRSLITQVSLAMLFSCSNLAFGSFFKILFYQRLAWRENHQLKDTQLIATLQNSCTKLFIAVIFHCSHFYGMLYCIFIKKCMPLRKEIDLGSNEQKSKRHLYFVRSY